MIEKKLFDAILSKIRVGAVKVVYWDDDARLYGEGKPYFTMRFKSAAALRAMLINLTLGFGEGYMNGLIEIEGSLSNIGRLVSENRAAFGGWRLRNITYLLHRNVKSKQQAYIHHHYDLGNDFYRLWLDKSMTYSCAYFRSQNDTLEVAQAQKVQHILRKLQLQDGHRLLDIGSGWGTLLITAAQQYGVSGLGITLSEEQLKHATAAAKKAGVADKVRFELCNYQDLATRGELFDRIVSVGMFEHVGKGNHAQYYRAVVRMLREGGLTVLHTISQEVEKATDPWIDKYIFPGGYLPSVREVVSALPKYDLRLLDYENLRLHYAMTLEEWQRRFNKHRAAVIEKYDERFYRMWDLWLASSAAGFRYGDLNLSQFVLTKGIDNDLPLTRDSLYK